MPDVADLRLLGEIINHGAIGLPQAAWNAGMSQSEAAARLVTMAERGMPLRLVAEGDRQLLWQIAQAGPVQPFPPAPPVPPAQAPPLAQVPPLPHAQVPPLSSAQPAPKTGPLETMASGSMTAAPVMAATTGPVGTISSGEGTGAAAAAPVEDAPVSTVKATGSAPAAAGDQSAVWGVPGTSSWVRPPEGEPAETAAEAADPDAPAEPETPDRSGDHPDAPTDAAAPGSEPDDTTPPADDADASHPSDAAPSAPTRRVLTSGQPVQAVEGLFGEQLDVGLQQILDPADNILTAVGYRIEEGERALLVQTSVGNRGPADYESLADLYLELVDGAGTVLRKAAMSVNGYPAHQVGVPANTLVSGWTVFLVPLDTEVAQVRWSVRPDLAHRTVSWGFGPASAERD